jgi:DNA-binding NarL/FixJ family response regulator
MALRILIADDHEVVREGVRIIIHKARPQWEICGEAVNGQEAIDAAARLKPDIVLLDITMPGMSGLEAASQISGLGPSAPILIFTMHESAELAVDARQAGARGYVAKSDAARHLVTAIETLLSGGTFFGKPEKIPNEPQGNPSSGIQFRVALDFSL